MLQELVINYLMTIRYLELRLFVIGNASCTMLNNGQKVQECPSTCSG